VRHERQQAGLTQAELAKRAHVSREWLIKVESASTSPEFPRVLDVLEALGLSLDITATEAPDA
jgi:transcriptional regulator with XRE-family HTH domain